jgi:hypothetical protein
VLALVAVHGIPIGDQPALDTRIGIPYLRQKDNLPRLRRVTSRYSNPVERLWNANLRQRD